MYFDGAGVPRTYTGKTEMSYRCRILIPHLMLTVFLCLPAFSEGNIGVTYHRGTFDDSRWGVRGDADVRTAGVWEYIGLDIDGHLQFGDVYTGNIETGLTLSSLGLGVRNLQLLCQACNSTKGTGTQEQLIEKLKADRILPAV